MRSIDALPANAADDTRSAINPAAETRVAGEIRPDQTKRGVPASCSAHGHGHCQLCRPAWPRATELNVSNAAGIALVPAPCGFLEDHRAGTDFVSPPDFRPRRCARVLVWSANTLEIRATWTSIPAANGCASRSNGRTSFKCVLGNLEAIGGSDASRLPSWTLAEPAAISRMATWCRAAEEAAVMFRESGIQAATRSSLSRQEFRPFSCRLEMRIFDGFRCSETHPSSRALGRTRDDIPSQRIILSLRAKRSNLHPVTHSDRDCRVVRSSQ